MNRFSSRNSSRQMLQEELESFELDILCINCQQLVKYQEIESHSLICTQLQTPSDESNQLAWQARQLIDGIQRKLEDINTRLIDSVPLKSLVQSCEKMINLDIQNCQIDIRQIVLHCDLLISNNMYSTNVKIYAERVKSLATEFLRDQGNDKIYSQGELSEDTQITFTNFNERVSTEQSEESMKSSFLKMGLAMKMRLSKNNPANKVSIENLWEAVKDQQVQEQEWPKFIKQQFQNPQAYQNITPKRRINNKRFVFNFTQQCTFYQSAFIQNLLSNSFTNFERNLLLSLIIQLDYIIRKTFYKTAITFIMSIALEMLYDNNREIAVFDTLDHFCRFINNLVISKMIDNENYIQNCILNFEKILRIGKTIIKIGQQLRKPPQNQRTNSIVLQLMEYMMNTHLFRPWFSSLSRYSVRSRMVFTVEALVRKEGLGDSYYRGKHLKTNSFWTMAFA